MNDVDKLMSETDEHYLRKLQKMHEESKNLKRANSKLKNEVRELKRIIYKLKQEKQKNHYRNGRRGTKFNG